MAHSPIATVDVVIPCYNYARYLRACAHSVLSQKDVDVRILIIDDASSDETPEVASELARAWHRVEIIRHKVNRGNIATYNEGLLDWSTADFTVLLSADDMLTPGSLSRAVGIMEADESIGMVYGPTFRFTDEDQLPKVDGSNFLYTRYLGNDWIARRCRAGHNVITSPEVVVRGSIQRRVGGYRPELPHVADLEMWLRIAAVSNLAFVRTVPQAFYRLHETNMTKKRNSLLDLHQRKSAFDLFWRNHTHLTNVERLHNSANRALAREALWRACRAYDHNQLEERRAGDLIHFALTTYPGAESLPEYRALRRRQRFGPAVCSRTQLFAAPAVVKRVSGWLKTRRWKQNGA